MIKIQGKLRGLLPIIGTGFIWVMAVYGRYAQHLLSETTFSITELITLAIILALTLGYYYRLLLGTFSVSLVIAHIFSVIIIVTITFREVYSAAEIVHLLTYAGLYLLIRQSFPHTPKPSFVILASVIANLVSVSDELIQSFVPGRFCDVRDLSFNLVGTILGILLTEPAIISLFGGGGAAKPPRI